MPVVGVRRLSDYLRLKFERDPNLHHVAVRGEVTNHSVLRGGHVSFELKEGDASLAAFVWQSDAVDLPPLRNGLSIVAHGAVKSYPGRSRYQIYATRYELDGIGNVAALFEERKKRLAADGLFAPERKRPLPKVPFAVALVSSRTSDGAKDFVTLLRARAPHVRVTWFETAVQGAAAAAEIATAIDRAARAPVDLIVVTRGGGSFEDLFVFSDERVVRAIARARRPVASAIGHTADQQLCDFAADAHFETPSAAAKGIGPATADLRTAVTGLVGRARARIDLSLERYAARLDNARDRSKLTEPRTFLAALAQRVADREQGLGDAANRRVRGFELRVRDLERRLDAHDPSRRLAERGRRLEAARGGLDAAVRARLVEARRHGALAHARLEPAARGALQRSAQRLAVARAHLDGNNPEAILQRGYAILTYDQAIVRDAASVPAGARVAARLARGTLLARVERAEVDEVEREGGDGNQRIG